jgi:hypothetical protein
MDAFHLITSNAQQGCSEIRQIWRDSALMFWQHTHVMSGVNIVRRRRHGDLEGANRDSHVPRTRFSQEGADRRW